jgi:hypothetical protein
LPGQRRLPEVQDAPAVVRSEDQQDATAWSIGRRQRRAMAGRLRRNTMAESCALDKQEAR